MSKKASKTSKTKGSKVVKTNQKSAKQNGAQSKALKTKNVKTPTTPVKDTKITKSKSKVVASKIEKSKSLTTKKSKSFTNQTEKNVHIDVKKSEKQDSLKLKQKPNLNAKNSKSTFVKTSEPVDKSSFKKEKSKGSSSEKMKVVVEIKETIEVAEIKSPKDQGDLLIAKAKEEMLAIHQARAEKTIKAKPIKIEKGNIQDEKAKWAELHKRHNKDKALPYKMTDKYDSLQPLQHKVLGWGFILSNENDRLEVLFENGIKMLISNYKPS